MSFHSVSGPPSIFIRPQQVVASVNDSVSSSCIATGSPLLTAGWASADGNELPAGVQAFGAQLVIPRLTTGHVGRYTCTAANANGAARQTLSIQLEGKAIFFLHPLSLLHSENWLIVVHKYIAS